MGAILFGWFVGTIIVAVMGSGRKIGVMGALLLSLLLSPLIGLIITLSSKRNSDVARENEASEQARRQTEALESMKSGNVAEQLKQLAEMRDSGVISEEDFIAAKGKLLS